MIPRHQTIFGKRGNCYAACIASILELPLEIVPNFCEHRDWQQRSKAWLAERGLGIVTISYASVFPFPDGSFPLPSGYCILSGLGPRGYRHCCVGFEDKVVFDPHPSGAGLVKPDEIEYFVILNPHYTILEPSDGR